MNTLTQGKNYPSDHCIKIEFNAVTQKLEVYLANEECRLAIGSTAF